MYGIREEGTAGGGGAKAIPRTASTVKKRCQSNSKVIRFKTSSGLKVNLEKSEIVIFYRTDTTTSRIKINKIEISTKDQEANVSS